MPHPNVHLFTGENLYALLAEERRWIAEFAKKHGDHNVTIVAAPMKINELLDTIAVAPFLGDKRLVVIRADMKFDKEDAEAIFANVHPSVLLLWRLPEPDKRMGWVKLMLAEATRHDFKPLARPALLAWMNDVVKRLGSELPRDAADELLAIAGDDQQALLQELTKLALYKAGGPVAAADVRLLAVSGDASQWRLTDLLAEGRAREAFSYARDLLARGEDAYGLWNILLWLVRSLVAASAATEDGITNPFDLAKAAGIPPFKAQSFATLARSLGATRVRGILNDALDADIALKTGGYRATNDDGEELIALIDRLILGFAK